jgi:chemotaxis protein methyltransferase CheR
MTPPRRAGAELDLDRFGDLVREESGLELPAARRPDLRRAVERALAATGLADADELHRHLRGPGGRAVLETLVGDLTVGETHFFRNRPQFEALERHILPELIERRRATRRLRLWSAACSTGEEPYSLAILVDRLLPDRSGWDVRILATDINRAALERARRGRYGAWSFREVPAEVVSSYFVRRDGAFEVAGPIREAVSFASLNLADDRWPSAATGTAELDLVLCRNVLIYFGEELTRRVAAKLHGALADGGWLLVAPAELSLEVFRRFTVRNLGGAVAYRKTAPERTGSQPAGPARRPREGTPQPRPPAPSPPVGERSPSPVAGPPAVHSPRERSLRDRSPRDSSPREPSPQDPSPQEPSPRDPSPRDPSPQDPSPRDAGDGEEALVAARGHLDRLELDQAQEWAEIACRRAPLSAAAHYVRGLALAEADRPDEALAALRRSVFLDPGSVLGQVALADLLVRQGEPARARGALRAAAALLDGLDGAEPVSGEDGPTAARVRDLVAAQLGRLPGGPEAAS